MQTNNNNNEEWFNTPLPDDASIEETAIQIGEFIPDDEPNATPTQKQQKQESSSDQSIFSAFNIFGGSGESIQSQIATTFAKNMFQNATKVQTPSGISFLKPYFDNVDEKQIVYRILSTVYKPAQPWHDVLNEPDLYGPLMAVLSFALVLAFSLKDGNSIHVFEGGLLITSLMTSILYWIGATLIFTAICRILGSTDTSLLTTLCVVGYEIFSIGFIALATYLIRANLVFYALFLTVGVISGLGLGRTLARTQNRGNGFMILGCLLSIHLLFILYIRFAYIRMYNVVTRDL